MNPSEPRQYLPGEPRQPLPTNSRRKLNDPFNDGHFEPGTARRPFEQAAPIVHTDKFTEGRTREQRGRHVHEQSHRLANGELKRDIVRVADVYLRLFSSYHRQFECVLR
jgi:hypothetical protein